MTKNLFTKTPKEIVNELDKHIIGQTEAKKAVAIALRNRYRRKLIPEELKNEITPKNILMIGATGVGKTEIARRLAKLDNAPFIKVEATKFTEIGYVGRDVETIIKDLLDIAINMLKKNEITKFESKIKELSEEKIINYIISSDEKKYTLENKKDELKKKLYSGELDKIEIEIDMSNSNNYFDNYNIPGMEIIGNQFQNIMQSLSGKKKIKTTIKNALNIIKEEEASKFINKDDIITKAIELVEQNGIVFLDEIDKITQFSDKKNSADVSREGVQRDLLPLIEGCNVNTKHGVIKTDYILFIAAGAFHISKPSDLIPELQGRLPIKVSLNTLNAMDFIKILLNTDYNLIKQYTEILKTENVEIKFTNDSITCIANIAYNINQNTENIGARRLQTVMEKLLEDILFDAGDTVLGEITIDSNYVYMKLKDIDHTNDINKFTI
ncbi:MAG TPA: ATP-dependent protease ATPase subunit HslU [Candidatus Azoamicus sp. MARI]